jgi:acetyl esterase/lipase
MLCDRRRPLALFATLAGNVMTEPITLDIGHGLDVTLFGESAPGAAHILAFHGGGGVDGSPAMMAPFARTLCAGPGVAVAVARYRTLNRDGADFEQMRADAAHALAWAQTWSQASSSGDGLFLLGASFGGLLALDALLEATPGAQQAVSGLILLNPVTDTGPGGFANRVISTQTHAALSPLARMAGHPLVSRLTCLMAHGGQDEVVPIEASRRFAALWPAARCTLTEFPRSSHGFFNRAPHDGTVAAAIRAFVGTPAVGPSKAPPSDRHRKTASRLPEGATIVYGVGAQKAGTSWLFDCLGQSRDCHTVPTKELHYFDALYAPSEASHLAGRLDQLRRTVASLTDDVDPENRARLRRIRTLTDRLSIHATTPGDHGPYVDYMLTGYRDQKIICDFTPSYCVLDADGFAEMNSIGAAKFIYVLRDPVARIWSQIRMAVGAKHRGLGDAEYEAKCAAHARDLHANRDLATIPRADYARTMAALEDAVPRDRIHYVFYEDLFAQNSVDAICDFLGIAPVPVPVDKKVNQGRAGSMPEDVAALLTAGLEPQYTAAFARFGDAVPAAWRARFDARNGAPPAAGKKTVRSQLLRGTQWLTSKAVSGAKAPDSAPVIAFLHIPKTAGQTVVKELSCAFPDRGFSPVRTHADAPSDAQMPPGYRLYAGHIDWVDLETLPDHRFAFTILRDPRERIASFYFYLLREAAKLSADELATKARTNMRMVSTLSADDYFFGGDKPWQRFIRDHYDNFYCNYLITRKVRGWKDVAALDQRTRVTRAIAGAAALQRVYAMHDLGALEQDMQAVLGVPVALQDNYVNAGPDAATGRRWDDLLARFEHDSSAARLEEFATGDAALMQQLGLSP